MSQYTKVFCDQGARGRAWAVLRYDHCAYDTARGALATRCLAPTTRSSGACDTALEACDTAGWGRHDRPRERTWACLGVLARPTGCALGAPSLFLDLVLFMSHCLDTVHEHCSSQKKNFKFFLIK